MKLQISTVGILVATVAFHFRSLSSKNISASQKSSSVIKIIPYFFTSVNRFGGFYKILSLHHTHRIKENGLTSAKNEKKLDNTNNL